MTSPEFFRFNLQKEGLTEIGQLYPVGVELTLPNKIISLNEIPANSI